jgi:hypothetical protein
VIASTIVMHVRGTCVGGLLVQVARVADLFVQIRGEVQRTSTRSRSGQQCEVVQRQQRLTPVGLDLTSEDASCSAGHVTACISNAVRVVSVVVKIWHRSCTPTTAAFESAETTKYDRGVAAGASALSQGM